MRRKRMKSNLVSSGTMRRCGITPRTTSAQTTTTMPTPTANRRYSTALSRWSDWHVPRTPPPHPIRHDQAGQGEGGEDRRDDADTESDGKTPHGTGTDEKQNGGG